MAEELALFGGEGSSEEQIQDNDLKGMKERYEHVSNETLVADALAKVLWEYRHSPKFEEDLAYCRALKDQV